MNEKELMEKAGYDEILQHRSKCPKWGKGFCLECFGGGLTAWSEKIIEKTRKDERKKIIKTLKKYSCYLIDGEKTIDLLMTSIEQEVRDRGGRIRQPKKPDTAGSGNAGTVGKATTMPGTASPEDLLLKLDWIKILQRAITSRPEAWIPRGYHYYKPAEWRNASDTLMHAVIEELSKNE